VAVAVLKVKGMSATRTLTAGAPGWTLHQLRRSLLTHEAETGTSTDQGGRSGKTTPGVIQRGAC
jgi:hypothetical protein